MTTDTLNVDNILDYSDNKFRVMLTTPGFACGDTIYSDPVTVINSELGMKTESLIISIWMTITTVY